jgi:hypothetical protein
LIDPFLPKIEEWVERSDSELQQSRDLGRLIGDEARAIRRDVHRELVETIERPGQQVWIPVTVAAVVPA